MYGCEMPARLAIAGGAGGVEAGGGELLDGRVEHLLAPLVGAAAASRLAAAVVAMAP